VVDHAAEDATLDLGRYASILRRRWLVVVLFLVLGIVLSVLYAQSVPRKVTAVTLVDVHAIRGDAFDSQRSASGLIDPVTEEQLASSSQVLKQAATTLGGSTTIAQVGRRSDATMLTDATVMKISYTAPTIDAATAGADAVGSAYVDYRTSAASSQVSRIRKSLTQQESSLQSRLVRVDGALSRAAAGSRQASEATSERQVLNVQLGTILTQITTLDSIDTNGGSIVTSAQDHPVAIWPHKSLLVEVGSLLGLIIGLIAAFVVNRLSRRVEEPATVLQSGGGAVLARLSGTSGSVPASGDDVEQIRSVREQIAALSLERPVITVVDLTRQSEPSDLAANLAVSFAETGREVDLLLPGHTDDFVRRLAQALEAGAARPGGTGPLAGPVLTVTPSTAARAGGGSKVTLVMLPPEASRSVTLAAARWSHTAVFVVRRRRTRSAQLGSVSSDLRAMHASVVGTVMVAPGRRTKLPAAGVDDNEPVASESRV
jgi:capsular polysaccharide biosynthesis protein